MLWAAAAALTAVGLVLGALLMNAGETRTAAGLSASGRARSPTLPLFYVPRRVAFATEIALDTAPTNQIAPTVVGSTVVGNIVAASTTAWTGSPTSYTYTWFRCDSSGAGCVALVGADTFWYTLTLDDLGSTIRVSVTATNVDGTSVPAVSLASGVVASAPAVSTTPYVSPETIPTTATTTTTVPAAPALADLGVTLAAEKTIEAAGPGFSFPVTINVANAATAGGSQNTHLLITLSSNVALHGTPSAPAGVTCTTGTPIDCSLNVLGVGQAVRIQLPLQIVGEGVLSVSARTTHDGQDANPANDTAVLSIAIPVLPTFSTSAYTQAAVVAGKDAPIVFRVTNDGTNGLKSAELLIGIPKSAAVRSAKVGGKLCTVSSGKMIWLTCRLGTLRSQASATADTVVRFKTKGSFRVKVWAGVGTINVQSETPNLSLVVPVKAPSARIAP